MPVLPDTAANAGVILTSVSRLIGGVRGGDTELTAVGILLVGSTSRPSSSFRNSSWTSVCVSASTVFVFVLFCGGFFSVSGVGWLNVATLSLLRAFFGCLLLALAISSDSFNLAFSSVSSRTLRVLDSVNSCVLTTSFLRAANSFVIVESCPSSFLFFISSFLFFYIQIFPALIG